jgi:hypothetical protein
VLIVHAGNRTDTSTTHPARFPESAVPAVTAQVGRLLAVLRPERVVTAPAAGADIVMLEQAQRLHVPVHVVLPLSEHEFEQRSVADRDAHWVSRYRAVLRAAEQHSGSTVECHDLGADPDWYLTANGLLVETAQRLVGASSAAESALALTIRPTGGETPPSVTDDFATKAEAAGLVVLTLDPRPGHGATTVG